MKFRVSREDPGIERDSIVGTMRRRARPHTDARRRHKRSGVSPKRVFEKTTKMNRIDFSVAQARRVFKKLGFEVGEWTEAGCSH